MQIKSLQANSVGVKNIAEGTSPKKFSMQ